MEQSTITCPKCGHATTETILQKHRTGKDGAEHEAGDKRGGECQDVDGHDLQPCILQHGEDDNGNREQDRAGNHKLGIAAKRREHGGDLHLEHRANGGRIFC